MTKLYDLSKVTMYLFFLIFRYKYVIYIHYLTKNWEHFRTLKIVIFRTPQLGEKLSQTKKIKKIFENLKFLLLKLITDISI